MKKLRNIFGLMALSMVCASAPAVAGTVNYTIHFALTSGSFLPVGSFTAVDGVTTASSLVWNGQTLSLPTLGSPSCPTGSGAYGFFVACAGGPTGTWSSGPPLLEIQPTGCPDTISETSVGCFQFRTRSVIFMGFTHANTFDVDPFITSWGSWAPLSGQQIDPQSSGTWSLTADEQVADTPEPSSIGLAVLGIGLLMRKRIVRTLRVN